MNGLHDPHGHKRTSITELLNPVAAPPTVDPALPQPNGFPQHANYVNSPHYPHQQMGPPAHDQAQGQSATFKLSAASWDQGNSQANGGSAGHERTRQEQYAYPRGYPTPPGHPPNMYQDHSRPRPREEQANFDPALWQSPGVHEGNLSSYNQPMIAPTYSDERTSLSGEPPSTTPSPYPMPRGDSVNYYRQEHPVQGYSPRPPPPPPGNGTAWQQSERASVRVAARTTQEHPGPPHPMYHPPMHPSPYYPAHPGIPYNGAPYPPQVSAPAPPPPPNMAQTRASTPPQSRKRPSPRPDSDEPGSGPKPKKARTRAKSSAEGNATTGSRRGYNAKKRSEAAQIAAQNAQLMPNVSYTPVGGDKNKQKTADGAMRIVNENTNTSNTEAQGPLHPELQFARCMSNRYKNENFPRCVSCTRRWAGDTCRFQGIRFFLKDDKQNIVGVSFVENQKADAPSMHFPTRWNRPLDASHIREIKRTVAHALLPTLREELKHLNMPEIIRRPRESDVRATCDTCMTSIFSSSWMCRQCGREACAECFDKVRELTQPRVGASDAEIAALQAKRETHAHSNPFFLSCTRRNEHQYQDFSPMSRFCKDELVEVIKEMESLLEEVRLEKEAAAVAATTHTLDTDSESGLSADAQVTSLAAPIPSGGSAPTAGPVGVPASGAPSDGTSIISDEAEIPSHQITTYTDAELTEEEFRRVWKLGIPLLVTGVLDKFKIKWDPQYFIQKYQAQTCSIVECQTDANKRITVGEFFKMFGAYEGRTECWKLKDWPPSTDFKTAFPELYDDFSKAVPMPNYCRRDGALNIASHFPANTVAPDLGPKMYNAMATYQTEGSKGSTRLHMDMADAVNVMLHAEPRPDGSPGVAAWDLYRAEDADKLRKFLKRRFNAALSHDPIHSQQIYLDSTLRQELFDEYKVMSYRVYQKPGEAVFIPAGCAHQVANLADIIKVAVDFVSPENIARCEKLTGEFREQNQSMVWKEDVLQLRTMMWFAWLSCTRQEAEK
ncbi:Clavaminate synthase-like protein [Artomyces pyxidatus]|uniref:Clavaminate synthase-like protein n=1 Tax=Artomyces pyxidatus TaxID=48021 RepID=A0ACB8TKX3_9AGAM|nr:Clavaminate synthase-like protein [Artomyces pyxidatus]